MSTYNQMALAGRPLFFMASPTNSDQSLAGYVSVTSNTLLTKGQPIIYGNADSFVLSSSESVVFSGNPFFKQDMSFDIVVVPMSISDSGVLVCDNGSGLYINDGSVALNLSVVDSGVSKIASLEIPIREAGEKLYIKVDIGSTQLFLQVDDRKESVEFSGEVVVEGQSTTLGSGLSDNVLFDGFGLYHIHNSEKYDYVDDPGSMHSTYAAARFGGETIDFSNYSLIEDDFVPISEFEFNAQDQRGSYSHLISISQDDYDSAYVIVEATDPTALIQYDVNGLGVNEFTDYALVSVNPQWTMLTFSVDSRVGSDFGLRIRTIGGGDVTENTPAPLTATGTPYFPLQYSESIVNAPQGIKMDTASYTGTFPESELGASIPKTVEIAFKANDSSINNYIYMTDDGHVATSDQIGYQMYLNGKEVMDMSEIRWGQWNHLVLINNAATGTQFYLNHDGSGTPTSVDYLFLTLYQDVLTADDISELYEVSVGIDKISVNESPIVMSEGASPSGYPFETFSQAWSIVGAGGS